MDTSVKRLGALLVAWAGACAALAQGPGAGGARQPGNSGFRNGHGGSGLHTPWIGSGTYERNLRGGHAADRTDSSFRSDYRRERDATLDAIHNEENRRRWLREQDRADAERRATVSANKLTIEAQKAARAQTYRDLQREQNDEIRARAAEQARRANDRQDRQAEKYDRIVQTLQPCAALENGTRCPRKANPGLRFCYRHVGWTGPSVAEPPAPAPTPPAVTPQPAPSPVAQPVPAPVAQPVPAPKPQVAPAPQSAPAPVTQSAPAPAPQRAPADPPVTRGEFTLIVLVICAVLLLVLVVRRK